MVTNQHRVSKSWFLSTNKCSWCPTLFPRSIKRTVVTQMPLLANLRLSNWRRTQFENSCDRKLRVEVYRRGPISTFITQAVIRIARRHTRLRMVVNVRFALQTKGLQIVSRELVVLSWITSNSSSSSSSRCTLKLSPLITQWKLLRKLSLSLICSLYLQMISLSSSKNFKRAIMNWIQLSHL